MLTALMLLSCGPVYREYDKDTLTGYAWKYGQEISFRPQIGDTGKRYLLYVGLRHLYGLQINSIPVRVKSVSPSGKLVVTDHQLTLLKDDQSPAGKCAGDICDLEVLVSKITFEEAGEYEYTVTHTLQDATIPAIMEVGLMIDMEN
jgi:gliding motility-associated lipoprotein GldH